MLIVFDTVTEGVVSQKNPSSATRSRYFVVFATEFRGFYDLSKNTCLCGSHDREFIHA
jgi:hypothetical protein